MMTASGLSRAQMPSHHHVTSDCACPRCGERAERGYSASTKGSGIRFSATTHCEHCSYTEEFDGPELTADARRRFYAKEGRWEARVRDLGPDRTKALHAIRSLDENRAPADALAVGRGDVPAREGALVEVEATASVLRAAGADVELIRIIPTLSPP